MTAWQSTTLRKEYAAGLPLKVVVYIILDVSDNDTVDVSTDFTEAKMASLMVIQSAVSVNCPVVSDNLIAIPALGTVNAVHDAGWLFVLGTAK